MTSLVEDIAFRDRPRATRQLERLKDIVPRGILERIRQQLATSADPDGALHWLLQFATGQADAFHRISRQPSMLQDLVTIFSFSQFLTQEVLQHPEWLEETLAEGAIESPRTPRAYRKELRRVAKDVPTGDLAKTLAQFRRRQYVRILLRDAQAIAPLAEATQDLSQLADAILDMAYTRIRDELEAQHGVPHVLGEDGSRTPCGLSVIALGKLGGEELNYSSDIDLMFIFAGNGETTGPATISNREFFQKVANSYTKLLSTYTADGLCYRVDLRLRPEGRLGEVAISLEGARQYYRHRARDWELQMLIKARVAAGEKEPGEALLRFVEPLIYSTTLDFTAVESVSEARLRIHEKAAEKRSAAFDVKLMPGGIRDIEFLVQCLQRMHGGREPWVRHGGTLLALSRLRDKELLSPSEYSDLASAYEFLRHLEHRLQLVDDRQTHSLPSQREEIEVLGRRMPANEIGSVPSGDKLLQVLNGHIEKVSRLYERVIHAQKPIYYGLLVESDDLHGDDSTSEVTEPHPISSNLVRFLDRVAPKLAVLLAQGRLKRNPQGFERFLERLEERPESLAWLDQDAGASAYVLDIFEHSPWLSDALNRSPELVIELRELGSVRDVRALILATIGDVRGLRQQFRTELFRILAESLCLQRPIFETLLRTSELADAAIEAAYRMAVDQVLATNPPQNPGYLPERQMMVIALGRLGMLEFDLGSDADLIFILPDTDEAELGFWTRVAERLIDLLTAYTGDGTLFAVDTRLRPGGRDGQLVQLERSYKEYFEKSAEAWEGIAYMKTRGVAGDTEEATKFLNELQKLDWRRYGQSGRSRKELSQMRMRLEKEQGAINPLKAGRGGYYDIDFAMMYLRLKGAGIFFKVLNTPERIDIVEQMGHLERADADFLRDAATFYRAIDHAIRLQTGHSGGSLPGSSARLEQLTEMVQRWTPAHLHDQPLTMELAQIQARTREYFERLFSS